MAYALVRRLEGRMEKRLPIAIVVHLVSAEDQTADPAELTYTDNVSAHGACVISSRNWKRGELAKVTSLKDENVVHGRVVHCQRRSDEHYVIGLTFLGQEVTWSKYSSYLGS